MLILSPSLLSAKMIDIGNNTYINTDYIASVIDEKDGCAVYLGTAPSLRISKYNFGKTTCKDLLKAYGIPITHIEFDSKNK